MRGKYIGLAVLFVGLILSVSAAAENFVDWKGNFWFTIPETWVKVDYQIVDQYLAMTDTSSDIFDYEAVFAPKESDPFISGAYLVVTFDSTGTLDQRQSDSVLDLISRSYATEIFDAPIVQLMTDLEPGKPKINRAERAISVLSEMAYSPTSKRMLWLYMRLNQAGLITLYCYSPEATFDANKPVFDKLINSLSFENLKEAAGQQSLVFTEVKGSDQAASPSTAFAGESGGISIYVYIIIILLIVVALWLFVIKPRMRKGKTPE